MVGLLLVSSITSEKCQNPMCFSAKKDPSHEELIKLLTKSIDAKIKKAKEMETDI
jgi:hypothetical protein